MKVDKETITFYGILLIAFTALFFLFIYIDNDYIYDEKVIDINSCGDSLKCETECYNFYGENVEDHFMECRYKCLTLMNCAEE